MGNGKIIHVNHIRGLYYANISGRINANMQQTKFIGLIWINVDNNRF